MVTRASIVSAAWAAVAAVCVAAPETSVLTLRSQRHKVSVSVAPIDGFGGPTYQAWPSYDVFSFGHGKEPAACYLQMRFNRYTDEPRDRHSAEDIAIHWNTTPLEKIREQYKREFQRPNVERITMLRVAGQAVRVHAVYDADGHFYAAEILRGDTVVSVELRSPTRRELQRHKASFLSFVQSLRTT